ncbi:restriction endonuclease subunit S [Corynebacterium mastitidis]|uniref:restriction endonuclease subunit S n=1 Tax=Corynebacterium mastitidis TaxID=161890 RepID=UPI00254B94B3|nr:restriction endonuclease subunit S [Corynebacterium mastitidis]MDK8451483.1 restriction endonuclease subunit S [Corynebacterium mastitidis]
MSIYDTLKFQPMLITDVFESMQASQAWYDKNKVVSSAGQFAYVSRSAMANGLEDVIGKQSLPPNPEHAITIGVDTQTVFYQPIPFYTSVKIQVLRHHRLNELTGPVLVTLLRQQMGKFQWGNGASLVRLKATKIMVPVTVSNSGETVVDWDGISELGRELFTEIHTHRARPSVTDHVGEAPVLTFEPMLITDVFQTYRQVPSWLNLNEVVAGLALYPHVTNSANANSVAGFISEQQQHPNPGNAITVGIDTQVVAYQPVPFYGATKVFELRSSSLSEASALVLVASLKRALEKFSWGHKASATRLAKTRFMVPVSYDNDGNRKVDWDSIELYGWWLIAQVESRMNCALPA